MESLGPGHYLGIYFRWFDHHQDNQKDQEGPIIGYLEAIESLDCFCQSILTRDIFLESFTPGQYLVIDAR